MDIPIQIGPNMEIPNPYMGIPHPVNPIINILNMTNPEMDTPTWVEPTQHPIRT
jgi:hypothetical protein